MKNKYDIIWLQNVDSTNEEARRRFSECDNLSVLSAVSQTSGKGQRGNSWSSEPGANLTFSIILKDGYRIKAYDQFVLSEITALSVIDFLSFHGIDSSIKWPNDIYIDKKKICGILVENSLRGEFVSSSIIGIGLNINQRNFDVNLPNPTSMILEDNIGKHFDVTTCLEKFMEIFSGNVCRFLENNDNRHELRRKYLSKMWRKDEACRYIRTSDGGAFNGIIRDLSEVGHLILENNEGELMEFAFKEISYII
jgi:BirA family biotin operon repressor/biotin-[acetyl-CoA-carboxylase] ligase